MFKKIIPLFLASTIVFSCMVPVFAVEPESANDVIIGTLADGILTGLFPVAGGVIGSAYGQPAAGVFIGTVVGEGIKNLSDYYAAGYTDEDLYAQFDEYNLQLVTDLGTSSIGTFSESPAVYMTLPVTVKHSKGYLNVNVSGENTFEYFFSGNQQGTADGNPYVRVTGVDFAAPCDASASYYCVVGSDNFPGSTFQYNTWLYLTGVVSAGQTVKRGNLNYVQVTGYRDSSYLPVDLAMSGVVRACFVLPQGSNYSSTCDVSVNSRPSTLTTPIAVRNDNDTYTTYNQNVVNETDNIYFNPVTNVTFPYTDWTFDYSTRTYTLTLEDGSTVTVEYGNENIIINEGDQTYNVYYVIPSEDDPGADPGGSGDTPGTDDGSGWAWLKGAWTEMMDKLSGILEAITDLELSPEINVDVEINGEEQVTQESWFSDLLTKFGFITSVHSIYSQLIADVTSDAATAAAVADGEVMLADVTSGHAAIDGSRVYTAPELAISFGASDKYGVDWANIRALDLSWYAPHKETVDGILSGILWLSYLFLLIKRAPGIIRGAEMVTEDRIKIDNWRMRH